MALDEITEDGEEPPLPERSTDSPPPRSIPSRKASTDRWPSRRSQAISPNISVDLGKSPVLSQKSSVSRFLVREESGQQSVTQLDTPVSEYAPSEISIQDTIQDNESITSGFSELEQTSTNTPSILSENGELDFDKYYAELYKPKVKLGPRPVKLPERGRRSFTSSSPSHSRPVSSLPAGLHVKSTMAGAPQLNFPSPPSTSPPTIPLPFLPRPPPIPDDSLYPPRPGSRGSSRSLPISSASIKTSKSTMTPEKQRLMKAMELRKKQMRRSTPNEPNVPPTVPENVPAMPTTIDKLHTLPERTEHEINKADSGIQMDYEGPINSATKEDTSRTVDEQEPGRQAQTTLQAKRSSTLSVELPAPYRIHEPKFQVDSPTLGRTFDTQQGMQRSLALPSLLRSTTCAEDSSHSPVDTSTTRTEEESMSQSVSGADSEVANSETDPKNAVLQQKRRGWVEPLTINVDHTTTPEHEHNYLSDDEFLEELQSATLQEATPIMLQRSPASPFFPPRRPSARSAQSTYSIASALSGATLNSIMNQQEQTKDILPDDVDRSQDITPTPTERDPLETQADSKTMSSLPITQVQTPESERGDPLIAPRRNNVSSGISKRIQALAEKSAREGSPPTGSSPQTLSAKSSLVSLRKNSLQDPAQLQTTVKRPVSKLSVWPAASKAPMAQPNLIVNRSANRDSVSVTARIVRRPSTQSGAISSPTELHHSPLLINHTRGRPTNHEFPPMAPLLTNEQPPSQGTTSPEPRDRSLSPAFSHSSIDSGPTSNRKSFDRKSYASRHKSESQQKNLSKHTSMASLASDSRSEIEKPSRTSRFLKRMSHIGGNKKKTQANEPSIQVSAPPPQKQAANRESVADMPPAIVIGDLNVQFPDTGLWKRRWVEIDFAGNLIFTASRPVSSVTTGKSSQGFVTKFNLKELKGPYIPDLDRQEMPHSVLFDLSDGATLSCASEDNMAQRHLMSCKC